jgi:putative oxidoreductase
MPHHRGTLGFSGATFMTRLNALQSIGLPILRLALGVIFIWHGYPKLTHPNAMQGMFVQHGLPGYFVSVAGVLEVFGGGLLILGFLTRIAGFLLAVEMAVAIWKVHSGGGYMAVHIYEFPLVLAAACFALATVGAGRVSAD